MAALMAILLLIATLSVSDLLHQSLHHGSSLSNHFCLVCSLAKGQANGPESPILVVFGLLSLLFFIYLP
ncbi:MAG TPA: hypothetical protein VL793_09765, partial [Patescibacteria group bacterium]|nr:hypothetical protein [Patescibacteria group bacterium]